MQQGRKRVGINVKMASIRSGIGENMKESETIREKRKFAIELKQLVHQKCVEINHYVSGCDSPFSYTQIADVQENLREIENTLNIKVKE